MLSICIKILGKTRTILGDTTIYCGRGLTKSSPTDIAADAACVTGEMVGANELVNGVVQSAGARDMLKWLQCRADSCWADSLTHITRTMQTSHVVTINDGWAVGLIGGIGGIIVMVGKIIVKS